jgi:hypothetical protein
MKRQQDHRTDELEELLSSHSGQNLSVQLLPGVPNDVDPEVGEMVTLARNLQASPSLIANPVFAQRLERKVLAHRVRYTQTKASGGSWRRLFGMALHMRIVLASILLCLLTSTGTVLAMAASVSNPSNPLYNIKVWEQDIQLSLTRSSQNQVDVSLRIIRDRLNAATNVADASHASAYHRTIEDVEQRIDAVSQVIDKLPAGSDRQRFSSELATVKNDARRTLYSLLSKLPFTEQLTTTTFLGHLGASVPSIQQATVVVTGHPSEQAKVTIVGTNLTNRTRLVINNQLVAGDCTLQHNTCVFVVPWHNEGPPGTVAVLNNDNTAAQMAAITFVYSDSGNGNNGSNENGTNSTSKSTNGNDANGNSENRDSDNGHGHNGNNK